MLEWFLAPTGGLWKKLWYGFYTKTICTRQLILSMDTHTREGYQNIYIVFHAPLIFGPCRGTLKKNFDIDFMWRPLALGSWSLAWIYILGRAFRKYIIFLDSLILAPTGDFLLKSEILFFKNIMVRRLIFSMDRDIWKGFQEM